MYLWDELDDLLWAARHLVRKAWHAFLDRSSRHDRALHRD